MSSGVKVADETKNAYQDIKMRRKGRPKLKYGVFKLSEDLKEIVIDEGLPTQAQEECDPGEDPFHSIISLLPRDDGRYLIYDFDYKGSFGPSSKVIMVMWCPSGMSIKKKMLYASSKDALKKACPECVEFQADCCEDLECESICQKLCKV